jgi:hypothetical protein
MSYNINLGNGLFSTVKYYLQADIWKLQLMSARISNKYQQGRSSLPYVQPSLLQQSCAPGALYNHNLYVYQYKYTYSP